MATNWDAILSNTNNLQDVLSILKKVLAQLDIKVDETTVDEALAKIQSLDTDVNEKLGVLAQELTDFEIEKNQAFQDLLNSGGFRPFTTEVELKAYTPTTSPVAAYAFDTQKVWLWNGSAWLDEGTSALDVAKALIKDERDDREALIDEVEAEDGLVFFGNDGFEVGNINQREVKFKDVIAIENSQDEKLIFLGNDDFELGVFPEDKQKGVEISENQSLSIVNVIKVENSLDEDLRFFGNDDFELGGLYNDEADRKVTIDISKPLFYAQPLCSFAAKPFIINVPSLISQRKEQASTKQVLATISAQLTNVSISSRDQIYVPDLSLFNNGYITLRDTTEYKIARIYFTARIAATSGKSNVSPKILMIGDSITNRELINIARDYLVSYSYNPTFIGTLNSSAVGEVATQGTGELGEAREGWETGDYTYLVSDRAQIVASGSESTYLALEKSVKKEYNPFLRVATSSDDSSIIRNGYVLDFTYYQSRFSLATPDVIVLQLGTNDIRDRDEPILTNQFYSEMKLIIQRIRAAWANVKIILSLPNTAADPDRDALWQSKYAPLIRKLMQLRLDLADPKIYLAPTWALSTSEAGYSITTATSTTDSLSSAQIGTLADNIHPQFVTRYQLAHSLAAYIACAADNLI